MKPEGNRLQRDGMGVQGIEVEICRGAHGDARRDAHG